ncbi:MAG: LacI family transcriptional regulator [Treponema sp.]|nr:LacI family transcriptional regulator [Treponema sp.]
MSITQKEIANDLGISFITVSRVFNNSGYVSAALRKRILDYAEKSNYIPHRASQILVRKKIQKIALFTAIQPDFFWQDIEKGALIAADYLKSLNYEVHFIKIPSYDTEKYCNLLKNEIKNGLDAAAFVYLNLFDMDKIIKLVEKANIPFIFFNIDDPLKRGLGYVGTNTNEGGRLAANFTGKILESKSEREVLIVHKSPGKNQINLSNPDVQRLKGFLSVIEEQYPLIYRSINYIDTYFNDPKIEQKFASFLKEVKKKPDVIYMLSSHCTQLHNILKKYECQKSVIIQHDIDDEAVECLEKGKLGAVVYQDPILQGYTAVRILEKILDQKNPISRREIMISHSLILKENVSYITNHSLLWESNMNL